MSGFFNKLFGTPENSPSMPNPNVGDSRNPVSLPAARPFTVSELANLLPPEFVRLQGVDVNRTVALNLDTAQRTIAEGRPAVMLSEIFQACPEIFPRPVTPADDFEVRLPVSRVRALLGQEAPPGTATAPVSVSAHAGMGSVPVSPFQSSSPFQAAPAASPFGTVSPFQESSPFQASAAVPAAVSPFQTVAPASEVPASPFQAAPTLPSPFQSQPAPVMTGTPQPVATPFESLAVAPADPMEQVTPAAPVVGQPVGRFLPEPQRPVEKPVEIAPTFSPFRPVAAEPVAVPATERVAPMAPAGGGVEVRFDLADSLKAVSVDVLGFSARQLPAGIECKVAQSKVRRGVFPGTGLVALRDVVSALPVAYRSVFGAADLDHELVIPYQAIGDSPTPIPDESIPEPEELITAPVQVSAAPVSAPVFETPFAALAREDASIAPPIPAPVVAPVAAEPTAPLAPLAPIAAAPMHIAPAPKDSPMSPFFASVHAVRPEPEPEPEPEPLPLAPMVEPISPLAPLAPASVEIAPVETVPAAPVVKTEAPTFQGMPADDDDYAMDFRQLELRAVFGYTHVLPREDVFRLATGLEGVKAAGYFAGEKLVFGSAPDGLRLETMPSAYTHLVRMAHELGISDARALTVQTERGLLAFFSEGEACLAVLHEGRRFAQGVRERLVLILRELARG